MFVIDIHTSGGVIRVATDKKDPSFYIGEVMRHPKNASEFIAKQVVDVDGITHFVLIRNISHFTVAGVTSSSGTEATTDVEAVIEEVS